MNKDKLIQQLFIGKVVDILGFEKTIKLLKEAKESFQYLDEDLTFTEKDLVEFGNQLLSKQRKVEKNKDKVNDSDLQNFYESKKATI